MAIIDPITRLEHYLAAVSDDQISVPDPILRIERYMNSILNNQASDIEPITRIEHYLAKISGANVTIPEPILRVEFYLAAIAGEDVDVPEPITRIEQYLNDWYENGMGELATVSGEFPLSLVDALEHAIRSLTQTGLCEQDDTPTLENPVSIKCNNGTLTIVDDELPSAYKRVIGFSCNNNAMWVIPDFYIKGTDTLRVSCSITATSNLIGSYSGSTSGPNYSIYASTSNVNYLRYYNTNYNSQFDADTRYDIVMTPTGTHGMKKDSEWETVDFTTERPFCIGTTAANITTSAKLKGNLYGDIIVDGRLQLVPCERLSDNALGYYDLIGETFYEQSEGYDGAESLGYDDSHLIIRVVGTAEILTVTDDDSNTQTASVADLYAVGAAVDEHDVISGTVTRRCGVCLYDGTQDIGDAYVSTTGGKDIGAIIVYPLETSATESVVAQPLHTNEGTNTVSITSEISGIEAEIKYVKSK